MEAKLIQVINKMIENSQLIRNVMPSRENSNNEFFFVYDVKYKWSIFQNINTSELMLFYYPSTEWTIEQLAGADERLLNFITYHAIEYKSKEATESFQELFNVVKSKQLGMDQIFDDILS